ncbi:MAG: AIR synthase related protein [Promethearchaeota archaeon]
MDIPSLVSRLRGDDRIKNKLVLHDVLKIIKGDGSPRGRIYRDIGEDAAALDMGDMYLLVSSDMISSTFLKKNPDSSGYSAILVGIDDIYACGGTPLACTVEVQGPSIDVVKEIMGGARRAAEQFNVTIVRGHTSIIAGEPALSCTVMGEIKKDEYISAGGARPGDVLFLIWDPDGRKSPNGPYWDAVTLKSSDEIMTRLSVMQDLARERALTGAKDISNSGIIGTTYMMANYSRVGCDVEVGELQLLFNAGSDDELYWWMMAYLTNAFVASANPDDASRISATCSKHSMVAKIIGRFHEGSKFNLVLGGNSHEVLDWKENPIFP